MRRADIEVPNLAVDVNSWARSACYPRGSFYPLSHGPSTRYRGITNSIFRSCSTCRSRSQASSCVCTHWPIATRPEDTFERLRYSLGGDRPSQTTRQPLSFICKKLEPRLSKSGISPFSPPPPQGQLQRVPPILRMLSPDPMASCSKAPRGLFVLLWVTRIFTGLSISPGPSSRQRPDRYAFRAGRNLPDKEFRYLRTVIVTAAVYWGFGSVLAHLPLTFQHWAGISPYTYTSVFAETYGFVNQSPGPFHCDPLLLPWLAGAQTRVPLLPKLRGHFAEFLNEGSPVHLGI